MKYPSQIIHDDISSYFVDVDYLVDSKNKIEIDYKLSLLEQLEKNENYNIDKTLLESKIESLISELSLNSLDMIRSLKIENIIGNSILIRFSNREDIRLNIYFDNRDNAESEDCEEAYLSYLQETKRMISVGAIRQIVPVLKSLMS